MTSVCDFLVNILLIYQERKLIISFSGAILHCISFLFNTTQYFKTALERIAAPEGMQL
jgi:hypothetical protein